MLKKTRARCVYPVLNKYRVHLYAVLPKRSKTITWHQNERKHQPQTITIWLCLYGRECKRNKALLRRRHFLNSVECIIASLSCGASICRKFARKWRRALFNIWKFSGKRLKLQHILCFSYHIFPFLYTNLCWYFLHSV